MPDTSLRRPTTATAPPPSSSTTGSCFAPDPIFSRSAFETPALFLRSEEWTGHPNNAELHQTTGTTHEQFTMLYMYAPATRWAGLLGSVDPAAFADFQRRTARRFLQTHLRGGSAPALDADFVRRIR